MREALEEVVDLTFEYADAWGAEAAEKLCQVFSKAVRWASEFGTGGIEANAKNHVFSGRVMTRTYD